MRNPVNIALSIRNQHLTIRTDGHALVWINGINQEVSVPPDEWIELPIQIFESAPEARQALAELSERTLALEHELALLRHALIQTR